MRITIFGASGKVGSLVLDHCLRAGYDVVAFTHSNSNYPQSPNLKIFKGDIYDPKSVTEAIKGSSLVISTLGSWHTKKKDVLSTAMTNIIPAMIENSLSRVISLTGSDARANGDSRGLVHDTSHLLISLTNAKILKDGENHIKLLEDSQLDWTVVRSPIMNKSGRPDKYILSSKRPNPWNTINRESVAQAMFSLITDTGYSRQAPYIVRT